MKPSLIDYRQARDLVAAAKFMLVAPRFRHPHRIFVPGGLALLGAAVEALEAEAVMLEVLGATAVDPQERIRQ